MPYQSYQNPRLVEKVVLALARFSFRKASWPEDTVSRRMEDRARTRLANGIKIIDLLRVLHPHLFNNQKHLLLEVLNCDDFSIVPKIGGPVRAVDVPPLSDDRVGLYTDDGIILGNDYLVRLAPRARPGNKAQYKWAEAFDHLEGLCRKARSGGKDEPDPAKVVGDFLENLDPKHQPTPRSVQRHVNEWRKRRVL